MTALARIAKRKRAPRATYHHGALRDALLIAALETIARNGVGSVSLRELARELGVSHSAPAHHFPDRTALFTALAAAGYGCLHDEMAQAVATAAHTPTARLNAAGRGYVLFAVKNPAYFEVMFHPNLLRRDDAALDAARDRAWRVLTDAIVALHVGEKRSGRKRAGPTPAFGVETLHAWSVAHGLASLWLTGNITKGMAPRGIEAATRQLFGER